MKIYFIIVVCSGQVDRAREGAQRVQVPVRKVHQDLPHQRRAQAPSPSPRGNLDWGWTE